MATETTKNEQLGRESDPAQSDTDPNQITDDGRAGKNASMYDGLSGAQTAGSRNDRVTEYVGVKRNVEPTAEWEHTTGKPAKEPAGDAPGISNRTIGAEKPGQDKVMGERAEASTADDADGLPEGADKPIEGGLPSLKEEKVKTVNISAV